MGSRIAFRWTAGWMLESISMEQRIALGGLIDLGEFTWMAERSNFGWWVDGKID